MSRQLIDDSLVHYAETIGDPYTPIYRRLYAHDPSFQDKFVLDTDEGLRRNMLRTTLEIITTYVEDDYAAANLVTGARINHIGYDIGDTFDVFFAITRDVIAEGCGDTWTPDHAAAWAEMLAFFETARID